MSGIPYDHKEWLLKEIEQAKYEGETCYITNGGPCEDRLLSDLKSLGFDIERFQDSEIIIFNKETVDNGLIYS